MPTPRLVAAVTSGIAFALAACKGGSTSTSTTVTVAAVNVTAPSQSLLVGATEHLTATVVDASGNVLTRTVAWSSSATAVAIVATDGTVTGVAAGSASITATVSGVTGATSLTINNVAPALTMLAPASATAGANALTLMLQGTGFLATSVARWNGSDRPTTFVSATQLDAAIPATDLATAGTAQVTVFTPAPGGGTSPALAFAVMTVASNPVPSIVSATPTTASAGGAAFTLTVTGTNFIATSVVRWNGQARTTAFVSATQLTAQITTADIAGVGTAQVTVFNPSPGGGTSTSLAYTITGPSLTAVSPILALAGGTAFTATVTGSGFAPTSVVQWNGQGRATTFVSATQLTALITVSDVAAPGTGAVTVQTPGSGGGTSAPQSITVLGSAQSIAAGGVLSCAISATSALYCWGDNRYNYLGDGSAAQVRATPVPVGAGLAFASVDLGYGGSCALTTGGALYCWGPGDGISNASTPTHVGTGLTFAGISRGASDVCGIATDSHTYCWGANTYGEDGDGTTSAHTTPVMVTGGLTFVVVSVGVNQSCGLIATGAAYCWGHNDAGELGNGNTTDSDAPVPVAGGNTFVAIAAGNPSCAIARSGAAYCWGDNSSGVYGNGTTVHSTSPVPAATGLTFTSLSVFTDPYGNADGYACGITLGGVAYCWGVNINGVLGDGQDAFSPVPMPIAGGLTFSAVSAGQAHACGITSTGTAQCWGQRNFGYLGDGSIGYRNTPTAVAGGLQFTALSLGTLHGCGLVAVGDVYCWGDGSVGQLGNGSYAGSDVPVKVGGNHHFISLGATGGYGTCGIATDPAPPFTKTYCWGDNSYGAVGDGTTEATDNTPVAVLGALSFQSVGSGANNIFTTACGVTTGGMGYCWGDDDLGQLGAGFENNIPNGTPVLISGGLLFSSLSVGELNVCGIANGSTAYCWGDNEKGQLGIGMFGSANQTVPIAVNDGLGFLSISVGLFATCGVDLTGTGYCWGNGVPVAGGVYTVNAPSAITGYAFRSIQLGANFGCGIITNGTTVCWGWGTYGQTGTGTFQVVLGPQGISTVVGPLNFQSLFVGASVACGIVSGGQAYCWGDNTAGALGIGQTDHVNQPTPVLSGGVMFQLSHRVVAAGTKAVHR